MADEREMSRRLFLDAPSVDPLAGGKIVFDRAEGARLYDTGGRAYWDGISGIFVSNLGHGNERVAQAIKDQVDRLVFHPTGVGTSEPAIRLGQLLVDITPASLTSVRLINSGSEATEMAVKLTRQYYRIQGRPLKRKVISRYRSWHGTTLAGYSMTGVAEKKIEFEPLFPDFLHVLPPYCYRCPFDQRYPGCGLTCARVVERTIVAEGPETVAAVILDPIMLTAGVLVPPAEYFAIVREGCERHDVQMIMDEVITGFGRTGHLFASDLFGVQPDLMCLAKGISGGYTPLAATLISDRMAGAFIAHGVVGERGHTFGANPLSAAAGLANVSEIVERRLWESARQAGAYLKARLETLYDFPCVGDVRGEGLLLGLEFVHDRESKEPFAERVNFGGRVHDEALRRGLVLRASPGFIALGPPLTITQDEAEAMFQIVRESIAVVSQAVS
jgi:adenosylmethionine-8-amino-7-oxononanoate aminotransferase